MKNVNINSIIDSVIICMANIEVLVAPRTKIENLNDKINEMINNGNALSSIIEMLEQEDSWHC